MLLLFNAFDDGLQIGKFACGYLAIFDQVPNEGHGFAAKQSSYKFIDSASNDGLGLRLGGIDPSSPLKDRTRVPLRLKPSKVSLDRGQIHFLSCGKGRVDLANACRAMFPQQSSNRQFTFLMLA